MEKERQTYQVQVLDRAFRILDILAEGDAPLSLSAISERLDLHKSTAHRLVMVLENKGCVERCASTGKYHLGSKLIELGLGAASQLDVYAIAQPHLRALAGEVGETAHLGVLREGEVVSLVSAESTQNLRTPVTVGGRTPAHCTSLGKAMLAFGPPEQVEEFLKGRMLKPYTPKTIITSSRFRENLRLVRERGYAVDDEEREQGLRCIGAPVWNSAREVIAAISIAGPTFRLSEDRVPALAADVVRCANRISAALGYRVNNKAQQAHA
jgi:DNA-binding IclR family transcriptional regulator